MWVAGVGVERGNGAAVFAGWEEEEDGVYEGEGWDEEEEVVRGETGDGD